MSITDKSNKKRRWLLIAGAVIIVWAGMELVTDFFPEEEKEFRREFRNAVEETFPQQAAKAANSFGLTRYHAESAEVEMANSTAASVVLVHGLDDPGKVWMNLAPALSRKGFNVWQLHYPNDQPIEESARFFYDQLKPLQQLGTTRLAIVSHSMGGLVAREMLTDPRIAYIEKAGAGEVPRVIGLIMVATPNHGSELARFRLFGEIRDQWAHLINGQGHLLSGIVDGAGEAKIDLLPESEFLQSLNSRPQPDGVKQLVIAGVVSPWDEDDIHQFFSSSGENASAVGQELLGDLEEFLKSVSDGLGDGLVTVDSTRIDGVEHRTVPGTHLSMIRNITKGSSRVPPAVPIIIEYLEQLFPDGQIK